MKMIGRMAPTGPGGRDCVCCGDAPGKRKPRKRQIKRRERQAWKREAREA